MDPRAAGGAASDGLSAMLADCSPLCASPLMGAAAACGAALAHQSAAGRSPLGEIGGALSNSPLTVGPASPPVV